MKWVTRDHLHMDRVASPWLIRRFVDKDAEFLFVSGGGTGSLPEGAIPFGMPGVELSSHDENGSTFQKILRKYELTSPALAMLGEILGSGVEHFFSQEKHGHTDVAALKQPEGVGLEAISYGMMFVAHGDADNIERSMAVYDALHAYCRAKLTEAAHPELRSEPPMKRWDLIKQLLAG